MPLSPSHERRFDRQFRQIERRFPRARKPLELMRSPRLWMVRVPVALVLILGGFLAILPVFGLWMIPLGLLLLAVDVPQLKGPVGAALVRGRRWWERRCAQRRGLR